MVLVWTVPGKTVKGEDVIRIRVRNGRYDIARNIIASVENLASTLERHHLERQVPKLGLVFSLHCTGEQLICLRSDGLRCPHRIDVVESDASLPQRVRNSDDGGEDFRSLFRAQFHARARQKRP